MTDRVEAIIATFVGLGNVVALVSVYLPQLPVVQVLLDSHLDCLLELLLVLRVVGGFELWLDPPVLLQLRLVEQFLDHAEVLLPLGLLVDRNFPKALRHHFQIIC